MQNDKRENVRTFYSDEEGVENKITYVLYTDNDPEYGKSVVIDLPITEEEREFFKYDDGYTGVVLNKKDVRYLIDYLIDVYGTLGE